MQYLIVVAVCNSMLHDNFGFVIVHLCVIKKTWNRSTLSLRSI